MSPRGGLVCVIAVSLLARVSVFAGDVSASNLGLVLEGGRLIGVNYFYRSATITLAASSFERDSGGDSPSSCSVLAKSLA